MEDCGIVVKYEVLLSCLHVWIKVKHVTVIEEGIVTTRAAIDESFSSQATREALGRARLEWGVKTVQ